jgi:hypothetical protein
MSDQPMPSVEHPDTIDPLALFREIGENPLLSITAERDGERWKVTRTLKQDKPDPRKEHGPWIGDKELK